MAKLLICEKPDMARKFADALGAKTKKQGYYEGNGLLITYAVGHLYGLAEPEKYKDEWGKWSLDSLPIIPEKDFKLVASKGKSQQIKVIKSLISKSDTIYNCCDSGREGELIYRYITRALKVKKNTPQYRVWISSLSANAIKRGFENAKPLSEYDNLGESARLRGEADWLVGMNATRGFTIKAGVGGKNGVLSIGRCQTPALALIYDRQKEIDVFVPKTYYDVYGYFIQDGNPYRGKWQGERIEDKTKADEIIRKATGKQGKVTSVTSSEKKEYAPRLYSLSMLQRDASAKYKFGAKKTLDTLQSLYEKREMVTYPRTDSQYLTKDELPQVLESFKKLKGHFPEWTKNAQTKYIHPNNKLIFDESKINDHHAIMPTGKVRNGLTPDEKKIYDLVVQRFLMHFFGPYIYMQYEAITEVSGECFKTVAKHPVSLGWKENFSSKEEKADEEELRFNIQEKPSFCEKVEAEVKQTHPPKMFTEGTLITALKTAGNTLDLDVADENKELKEILHSVQGIGTEATRASIIETLKLRQYIEVSRSTIHITDKGKQLIEAIRQTPLEILTSPALTAKWEKALNSVAEGKMSPKKFEEQIKRFSEHIAKVVRTHEVKITASNTPSSKDGSKSSTSSTSGESLGTCPICKKGQVVENQKAYGCSEWRNTKCKFVIWKYYSKKKITPAQVKQLLSKGKTNTISGFKNFNGKGTFSAYLELNKNKEVEMKK